jgi:plastocyanin
MRWMTVAVLALGLTFTATCDDDDDNGGETGTTMVPGAPVIIQTSAMAFNPAETTITAGTTVRWLNADGTPHTVTSGSGSNSPDVAQMFDMQLDSGQVFDFVFQTPGTYPYFCRFHEAMGMRGTITVIGTNGGTGGTGGGGGGGGTGGSDGSGGSPGY